MTLPATVSPAPHLRLVCFPAVCVALDVREGSILLLPGHTAQALNELRDAEGASLFPAQGSPGRERALVALLEAGVLTETESPHAWCRVARGVPSSPSWGAKDSPAALGPPVPAPARWYVLGAAALLAVLVNGIGNRRQRFARTRRLVGRSGHGAGDFAAAEQAVHGVRRVGRLLPLRVACWEEAAATVVALRWAGYRAAFCHGVATDPVRLHAWIEVGGRPVAESDDITDYTPFKESCE